MKYHALPNFNVAVLSSFSGGGGSTFSTISLVNKSQGTECDNQYVHHFCPLQCNFILATSFHMLPPRYKETGSCVNVVITQG